MFSDERIEQLSGRIFRKGIAAATLLSALFLVCKLLSFGKFQFLNLGSCLAEITIVLAGIILLTVGELGREHPEIKDERYYTEKFSFYNKAAKIFLIATLAGFAVSVPIHFRKPSDLPANLLLMFLELLGLVFIAHQFKSNGINLNYSIIDESNSVYYMAVLKRMGKLALIIAAMYGISGWHSIWLLHGKKGPILLSILLACVASIVSLCTFYFLISWIEKVARNEEETEGKIHKSLLISFCFVMVLGLLNVLSQMAYYMLTTGEWDRHLTLGQTAALFNYINKYFTYYINAFLGLSLANALIYVAGKARKLVGAMIGYVYASIILAFFVLTVFPFLSHIAQENTIISFSKITNSLTVVLSLVYSVLQIVLFSYFVKVYGYGKWLPVLSAAMVALQIVCYFLQTDSILFATLFDAAGLGCTVLLSHTMITLKKHRT